jgi:hypothetical protein
VCKSPLAFDHPVSEKYARNSRSSLGSCQANG